MLVSDQKKIDGIFERFPDVKRIYFSGGRFWLSYDKAKEHGEVKYINKKNVE